MSGKKKEEGFGYKSSGCLIALCVVIFSAGTGNWIIVEGLFVIMFLMIPVFVIAFIVRSIAWVGDASGLGEGGKAKALLQERGYEWVTLADARALVERCGWQYAWIKKLPNHGDVAVTPVYQGDNVDSLVACAKIIYPREQAVKYGIPVLSSTPPPSKPAPHD
jgi:hypothetical protein